MKYSLSIISILLILHNICYSANVELYIENDVFAIGKSDKNYTHGTRIVFYDDKVVVSDDTFKERGLGIGQFMYTPSDLRSTNVVFNERPYAGWLYVSRLLRETTPKTRTTAELQAGFIGDNSFAEETQTYVHERIGSTIPQGWDNQIGNEIGINFNYKKHHAIKKYKYSDFVVGYGLSLGNVYSGGNIDAALRLGIIDNTFLLPQIEPTAKGIWPSECYILLRVNERYVAHNTLLEGSMLKDDIYTVTATPFVTDLESAIHINYKKFFIQFSYYYRTKEFEEYIGNHHVYGSIKLGTRW